MTSASAKRISLLIIASLLILNFPVQANKAAALLPLAPPATTSQAGAWQEKAREQAPTVTILGQVEDSVGQPAGGVRVRMVVQGRVVAETLVAGDGRFYFPPRLVDHYRFQVLGADDRPLPWVGDQPFVVNDSYVAEHSIQLYDALSVDAIVTGPVATSAAVDMLACPTLQPPGQITGVVTAADTGLPLRSTTVSAYLVNGASPISDFTDEEGRYAITGLAPGMYNVKFDPAEKEYAAEWYDNQSSPASATAVVVNGGAATANINAALEIGGQISGRITAADTGLPLNDVSITAYDAKGNQAATGFVEATGVYTLSGLATGGYRLAFEPYSFGSAAAYLAEYYNDQATLAAANVVNVTRPGLVNGIDVTLARGGQITGHITADDTGLPLDDVSLTLYDSDGFIIASASTNASGVYTVTGVSTGNYRLQVTPSSFGVAVDYIAEYYNDKSTLPTADAIVVTAPNVVSNIDLVLVRGAQVSGQVTAGDSALPLEDVVVRLYEASGDAIRTTFTDEDGLYSFKALPTGSYRLQFDPSSFGAAKEYLSEYYNDKSNLPAADLLTLTAPTVLTNINAALTRGGQISGRVTAVENSAPLDDVSVSVYNDEDDFVASTTTDATGIYTISAVATGGYRVRFAPFGATADFTAEYYNDKPSLATADVVTVTAPNAINDIDAALVRGAQITGCVTAEETGAPLADVAVRVYDSNGDWVTSITTNANGVYAVKGLHAGRYRLEFDPVGMAANYQGEYYDDKPTLATADPVVVGAASTVNGIDAALLRGGTIRGRVTAGDTNLLLDDVAVSIYDSAGDYVDGVSTDATGVYTVTGLATGNYRIWFDPFGDARHYLSEYHNDKADLGVADVIVLTAPNVVNVDAVMARGGQISGQVTAADTKLPLADVTVRAYLKQDCANFDRYDTVASMTTDAAGAYTLTGLPTGAHVVNFESEGEGAAAPYIEEYYDNQSSLPAAGVINVTAPNLVSGIDATLERGGQITGRVTSRDTGLPLDDVWIDVYDSNGRYVTLAAVAATGVYTTPGLPTGSYRLEFEPYGDAEPYAIEYHNDKADLALADAINLTAPIVVSGVDAALAPGGQIGGRVTAADGSPLAGASITAYTSSSHSIVFERTDELGEYHLMSLPTGAYRVRFAYIAPSEDDCTAPGQLIVEYYNDRPDLASADPITVNAPQAVTGVDAMLALTPTSTPPGTGGQNQRSYLPLIGR